jgi:hypothetical protein
MELYWHNPDTNEYNDGGGFDLDAAWDAPCVYDADGLKLEILHAMALWAMEKDYSLDKVTGFTFDHDSDELEISGDSKSWDWLTEVCQLVEFIKGNKHFCPDNAIFARIKDVRWEYFDFNHDLQSAEDEYYQEWDGNHEEFAKEYMSSTDGDIPDHLQSYFDYASFGEALVDDFDQLEFAGDEFLFSR